MSALNTNDIASHLIPSVHRGNREAAQNLQERLTNVASLIGRLELCGIPEVLPLAAELRENLEKFSVRVTLVGQVKAGKTALTNSLIGKPELLPSDVNPWTSVVTSVHLNANQEKESKAVFRFFTQDDWAGMVTTGGRLGEIAERTDFDDELAEVRAQVKAMQAAAEARLGRNFKYLLGQKHTFSGFHADLIKRYVCLGEHETDREGRFADVTKSADLYMRNERYVLPTVLRDTPGVNDPFLVREKVTLENLADTDICVVVLSANQALTTVDVALMRILLSMRKEQMILFVNRIDELEDIDDGINDIGLHIRQTLIDKGLPEDIPIVFGSALWANAAASGITEGCIGDSEERLAALIEARQNRAQQPLAPAGSLMRANTKADDLSGLGELQELIEAKTVEAVGTAYLEDICIRALDLAQQSMLLLRQTLSDSSPLRSDLDVEALIDDMDKLLANLEQACRAVTQDISDKLLFKMSEAYHDFARRETLELDRLVASGGNLGDWQPDSSVLVRKLNTAYQEFSAGGQKAVEEILNQSAKQVTAYYKKVLDDEHQIISVKPPAARPARVPTALMKTLTIDVTIGWLDKLFAQSAGKRMVSKRFNDIITDEMTHMIADMRQVYITDFMKTARQQLHEFMSTHLQTLQNLLALESGDQRAIMRRKLGVEAEVNKRLIELQEIDEALETAAFTPISTGHAA